MKNENPAKFVGTRKKLVIYTVFLNDSLSRRDTTNQKALKHNQCHYFSGYTKYPSIPFENMLKVTGGQKLLKVLIPIYYN